MALGSGRPPGRGLHPCHGGRRLAKLPQHVSHEASCGDGTGQDRPAQVTLALLLSLEDLGLRLWTRTCHRLATPGPLPRGLWPRGRREGRGGTGRLVAGRKKMLSRETGRERPQVRAAGAGSEAAGGRRTTGRERAAGGPLRRAGGPRTWAAPCGLPAPTASSAASSAPAGTSRSTSYTRASCRTPRTCSWGGGAAARRARVSSDPRPRAHHLPLPQPVPRQPARSGGHLLAGRHGRRGDGPPGLPFCLETSLECGNSRTFPLVLRSRAAPPLPSPLQLAFPPRLPR